MKGKVKWYNRKKGYGFVQGEDGKDYFVHFTGLAQPGFIRENDEVSFEPAKTDKGLQAKEVKLLKKASEMDSSESSEEVKSSGRGRKKKEVEEESEDEESEDEEDEEESEEVEDKEESKEDLE